MRKQWVIGNWKMNGTRESNRHLIDGFLTKLEPPKETGVAVCVPSIYLSEVASSLRGSQLLVGSQDLSEYEKGAFTGEISAAMVTDSGGVLTLVGHSERRSLYAETNEQVARKFKQALLHDLIPVLCVGETLEQRESGATFAVVAEQLDAVLNCCEEAEVNKAILAYEPVWAIGTGKTASADQAQEVHAFIRQKLAQKSELLAENVSVLYGGSVKPDNAQTLFSMPDIDGGLIGGASLDAESFLAIYNSTEVIG